MKSIALLLLIGLVSSEGGFVGISGGKDAPILYHPYQVSISVDNILVCSGALIHREWVLTVASCVKGYSKNFMKVRAGSGSTTTGGHVIDVSHVIAHSKFGPRSMDYDIALLKLAHPVITSKNVRPINIAEKSVVNGSTVSLSGWGQDQNGSIGNFKQVKMVTKNLSECKELMFNEVITSRMVCAAVDACGPCWGDFGDPLVNEYQSLVGLFSFTKECNKTPSIFTNVVIFKPWIQEKIREASHRQQYDSGSDEDYSYEK